MLEQLGQIRSGAHQLRLAAKQLRLAADPDAVTEPDPQLVGLAAQVVERISSYFRGEVLGLEKMPHGKALLVGNHNAGITSFEPFILGLRWYQKTGGQDLLHFLAHDMMVALPLVGTLLIKVGAIRATHQAADRAFGANKKVMVFPGGNYESFRPYAQRHRIDFGGKLGYVKLALRNRAPIVPVLCLGGHETFFVLWRGEWLAQKLGVKRFLRSDSCPLFVGLPWGIGFGPIFHLPLPAKLLVEVGDPISVDDYPADAVNNLETLTELSAKVQAQLQQMMDRRANERRWPVLG